MNGRRVCVEPVWLHESRGRVARHDYREGRGGMWHTFSIPNTSRSDHALRFMHIAQGHVARRTNSRPEDFQADAAAVDEDGTVRPQVERRGGGDGGVDPLHLIGSQREARQVEHFIRAEQSPRSWAKPV